jgi:hypothetical protein
MSKNDFEDMGEQTAQLLVNALGPVATLKEYHLADDVFPDLDDHHANCQMTTIVPGYCTDFYNQLHAAIDNRSDPAKGQYKIYQAEYKAANLWVQRFGTWGTENTIDDVDFSLEDQTDGTCMVSAKARS